MSERKPGTKTVQTALTGDLLTKWEMIVAHERRQTGVDLSEAQVLRRVISRRGDELAEMERATKAMEKR